ncbi:hypothetical protein SISNIDRAFT_384591, partial [Sistotremastrum niveocremeum HHB9708]
MTDYASEGRTRPTNPLDLSHCLTHQSLYTVFSRSPSLQGILIMDSVDEKKFHHALTRRATGFLRQEFRELEILNKLTECVYNYEIPIPTSRDTRKSLI